MIQSLYQAVKSGLAYVCMCVCGRGVVGGCRGKRGTNGRTNRFSSSQQKERDTTPPRGLYQSPLRLSPSHLHSLSLTLSLHVKPPLPSHSFKLIKLSLFILFYFHHSISLSPASTPCCLMCRSYLTPSGCCSECVTCMLYGKWSSMNTHTQTENVLEM